LELDSTITVNEASWTERLLGTELADFSAALRGLVTGLALAAVFGLALGLRYGAAAMVIGVAGVPLAFVAVAALGAPAFYIGVSHADLPITGLALAGAVSRGVATSGLVLAGLAPAAALLSVSAESAASAAVVGAAGLGAAGGLGMRRMMEDLRDPLSGDNGTMTCGARAMRWCFALFSTVLAARIWWLALPMLGRGAL